MDEFSVLLEEDGIDVEHLALKIDGDPRLAKSALITPPSKIPLAVSPAPFLPLPSA